MERFFINLRGLSTGIYSSQKFLALQVAIFDEGDPMKDWLDTTAAGLRLGLKGCTVWRLCKKHPGFGIRAGNHFRIPEDHLKRLLGGESIISIANSPSWLTVDEAA